MKPDGLLRESSRLEIVISLIVNFFIGLKMLMSVKF